MLGLTWMHSYNSDAAIGQMMKTLCELDTEQLDSWCLVCYISEYGYHIYSSWYINKMIILFLFENKNNKSQLYVAKTISKSDER